MRNIFRKRFVSVVLVGALIATGFSATTFSGLGSTEVNAASSVKIDGAHFPDSAFREYVKLFDQNYDNSLSAKEIKNVIEIDVYDKGIKSLKGVSYFTYLKTLECGHNNLKNLDLSKNIKLESLYCDSNEIRKLSLAKNTKLVNLNCADNDIYVLNISKCTKLSQLICTANDLEELIIKNNPNLREIQCTKNNLKELDITKNKKIQTMDCRKNAMKYLYVYKGISKSKLNSYKKDKGIKVIKHAALKTGDVIKKSGNKYKITSEARKTLALTAPKSKNIRTISLPEKIKVKGVTYYVASFAPKALKNCKKLKTITINSTKLTEVGKDAIKGIYKKAVIRVPKKQLKAYKKLFTKYTGYKKTMKIKKK